MISRHFKTFVTLCVTSILLSGCNVKMPGMPDLPSGPDSGQNDNDNNHNDNNNDNDGKDEEDVNLPKPNKLIHYCITGNKNTIKINDIFAENWNIPSYAPNVDDPNQAWLKPSSRLEIADYDPDIAAAIKTNNEKAIYKLENIQFGTNRLVGKSSMAFAYPNGKEIDNAYAFKIIASKNIEDQNSFRKWYPSRDVGQYVSLTPNNLWINPDYSGLRDEYNRDWNSDPLVVGGAGRYTLFFIQYKNVVNSICGSFALFKTESLPEVEQPRLFCYQLVGTMNNWNAGIPDIRYQFQPEQHFTFNFKPNDTFCVLAVTSYQGELHIDWSNEKLNFYNVLQPENISEISLGEDGNIQVIENCTLSILVDGSGPTRLIIERINIK